MVCAVANAVNELSFHTTAKDDWIDDHRRKLLTTIVAYSWHHWPDLRSEYSKEQEKNQYCWEKRKKEIIDQPSYRPQSNSFLDRHVERSFDIPLVLSYSQVVSILFDTIHVIAHSYIYIFCSFD
jgi:hypothetical protein